MLDRLTAPRFLWAGVVAPLLFTGVYLVDGATRAGYEPLRHQVSLLSLGDRGWVQVLSFLVTGGLLAVFAIALRGWLRSGPGARGGPAGVAVAAIGFVLAGVFTTQPMFGYPPGAPPGMATDVTPASAIHVVAALLLFFGLAAAAAVLAYRFRQDGSAGWATVSALAAVVVVVAFGASGGGPSGQLLLPDDAGLAQRIALLTGLGWVLALAVHAMRAGPTVAELI